MSADDELAAALARARADRLRFEGLPAATPLEIVRDAVERVVLTPEFQAWANAAIGGTDALAGVLLASLAPNAALAPLEVKALDFVLHLALSALVAKARADQASSAGAA